MRAVITRVNEASVTIGGQETARIGKGFLVLLGVHVSDTEAEADRIVDRICGLRIPLRYGQAVFARKRIAERDP